MSGLVLVPLSVRRPVRGAGALQVPGLASELVLAGSALPPLEAVGAVLEERVFEQRLQSIAFALFQAVQRL